MQTHTASRRFFQTRIYADLRRFLGFLALIRVNLRNPWLMTCSTIVEGPLQIGPSFFKTNPIFLRTRIIASSALTEVYQRIAACGDQKGKAKQSQLPAFWPEARSTKHETLNKRNGCAMTAVKRSCSTKSVSGQRGSRGPRSLRRRCLLGSKNRSSLSLPSCERVTDIGAGYAILELSPISKNNPA